MIWLAVVAAGMVGAPSRYLLDGAIRQRIRPWPLGTLVVNVVGSLVLGVLTGLVRYHDRSDEVLVVLGIGFCGAFTTFSTFAFEAVLLAELGEWRQAGAYVLLTVGLGLLAATLGLAAVAAA